MKKYMVLLLFCCVILFCFTGCFLFSDEYHLALDTPEKIAEVYRANEALFNSAAQILPKYTHIIRIKITPLDDEVRIKAETYSDTKIDNLYIISSEYLSASDNQTIYNAFAPILAALKDNGFTAEACMVGQDYNRIQFVLEDNGLGKYAELFYFEDSQRCSKYQAAWETSGDTLQLNDNWIAQIVYH